MTNKCVERENCLWKNVFMHRISVCVNTAMWNKCNTCVGIQCVIAGQHLPHNLLKLFNSLHSDKSCVYS